MKTPFFLVVVLASTPALAGDFLCGRFNQPERRVEKPLLCDDTSGYELVTREALARPELNALFGGRSMQEIEKDEKLKDLALEAKFRMTSNMNAARFTFPNGVSRIVIRGSYHAPQFSPGSVLKQMPWEFDMKRSCMTNLVRDFGLAKIVNYDELDWPSAQRMTAEEKELLKAKNPQAEYWEFTPHFGRTFQYKFKKGRGATLAEKKADIFGMVAGIVKEIAGDPAKPGGVYIHCYGGHHRTGVVYGVLQKCMGKLPVDDIIAEYKCHIGYESPEKPGGYHEDNETLIREFPCEKYFGN